MLQNKFILLLLLLFVSTNIFAGGFSCEIVDAITTATAKPELAGNPNFWKGLAKIKAGDDVAAAEFLKQYGVNVTTTTKPIETAAAQAGNITKASKVSPTQTVQISTRAEKVAPTLQAHLKERLNDFIQTVSTGGLTAIRTNNQVWHLKRLEETGLNGNTYVVRLKGDYRLSFKAADDGTIKILDIGHHVSH